MVFSGKNGVHSRKHSEPHTVVEPVTIKDGVVTLGAAKCFGDKVSLVLALPINELSKILTDDQLLRYITTISFRPRTKEDGSFALSTMTLAITAILVAGVKDRVSVGQVRDLIPSVRMHFTQLPKLRAIVSFIYSGKQPPQYYLKVRRLNFSRNQLAVLSARLGLDVSSKNLDLYLQVTNQVSRPSEDTPVATARRTNRLNARCNPPSAASVGDSLDGLILSTDNDGKISISYKGLEMRVTEDMSIGKLRAIMSML